MTLMCLPFRTKGSFTLPKTKPPEPPSKESTSNGKGSIVDNFEDDVPPFPKEEEAQAQGQDIGRRAAEFGGPTPQSAPLPIYEKDAKSRRFIEDGLLKNDFLKNLDKAQIKSVVDSMKLMEVEENTNLIQEGDNGSHMYVAAEGRFEVLKGEKMLREIAIGEVFGELALLYNAKRQASIRVVSKAKVWELDRKVFQQIMVRTGLKQREDNIRFLQTVPYFETVDKKILAKVSDYFYMKFFPTEHKIIKQGDLGDTFYIISGGSVKITKRKSGSDIEEELGTLSRGDFFGELALKHNDRRQATITALSPGVECLVLGRKYFEEYLGPLPEFVKDWERKLKNDKETVPEKPVAEIEKIEFENVSLKDLNYVATLGVGGFGRVELMSYPKENKVLALKYLKKIHVVQQQQQQHVYNEKKVMLECRGSIFVNRLFRTYKDNKYVYFLMEPCMGGDVFTILQKHQFFNETTARFMTACVVEAFDFLHQRNIVYRDLKPENVMLDSRGYVKMIDFGFAKKVLPTSKTWTFAGTPEYVAPEIILGKGHDKAVDYWALGIFMHELLAGRPPFRGSDHMKTYNMILKGIEAVLFPKHVSKSANRLIRRLCRAVAIERLGYQRDGVQGIRNHEWFRGFNWETLQNGTMKAPIRPQLSGPTDTRYFDKYPKSKDIPPDEFSGWDKDF